MKNIVWSGPAFLLLIGAIYAVEVPSMKEGLWSIHTVTISSPSGQKTEMNRSICRSHAYDEAAQKKAKALEASCKMNVLNGSGSKYISESECTVGGTTIHTKRTTTLTGDAESRSEETATYSPAMEGRTGATMTMEQKYVGACPAGMAPGEMMDADGKIIRRGRR